MVSNKFLGISAAIIVAASCSAPPSSNDAPTAIADQPSAPKAVEEPAAVPDIEPPPARNWVIEKELDPITDQLNISAFLPSRDTDPTDWRKEAIVIRCRRGELDVIVTWDRYLSDENAVTVRWDRNPPRKENWSPASSKTALFVPDTARFLDRVELSKTLAVEVRPYQRVGEVAIFDVNGGPAGLDGILRECPGQSLDAETLSPTEPDLNQAALQIAQARAEKRAAREAEQARQAALDAEEARVAKERFKQQEAERKRRQQEREAEGRKILAELEEWWPILEAKIEPFLVEKARFEKRWPPGQTRDLRKMRNSLAQLQKALRSFNSSTPPSPELESGKLQRKIFQHFDRSLREGAAGNWFNYRRHYAEGNTALRQLSQMKVGG